MTEKSDPPEVAALERSVNDSATRVSTIWVSYLIFSLYLIIATGTATHRQLLFAEPFKLPALNIDLPLFWFFVLGPILFVLFHLYVVLQVLLLGRTAAAYNDMLDQAVRSPSRNALVRQRLANTLFAQIFAGSPRERFGWLGWLLKAMAWITLALAPIYVILAFQFTFLPYHSHLATWVHRLLLLVELGVALVIWPIVLDARRDFDWRPRLPRVGPTVFFILLVSVSFFLFTFPGEPHVNLLTGMPAFKVKCYRPPFDIIGHLRVRDVNATGGGVSSAARSPEIPQSRNLSGRNFNCADLRGADLRQFDFSTAQLQAVSLVGAKLDKANFSRANLRNADLLGADIPFADFTLATLQGAELRSAVLRGAVLLFASAQGASMGHTNLEGAELYGAHLSGVDLDGANLSLASLRRAELVGADLSLARLRAASLDWAHLEGALMRGADLRGAKLDETALQGAMLSETNLSLAFLHSVTFWRAKPSSCSGARVSSPNFDKVLARPPPSWSSLDSAKSDQATSGVIRQFIKYAIEPISTGDNDEGNWRDPVRKKVEKYDVEARLEEGLIADIPEDDLRAMEAQWLSCVSASANIDEAAYLQEHAIFFGGPDL
jgi:uncharacterized protein YjbI with pentapeptide repeats